MKLDLDRQEHGRSELAIAGALPLGLSDGRPERADINGELLVDNVGSRFLLNGKLEAAGRGQCARCLREFEVHWVVPVEIIVLRNVRDGEGEGESLVLHQRKGEVDLSGALCESAILAFPQAPLCREDCRGLCSVCGIDRNDGTCTCADEDTDPRWDALP